MRTHHIPDSHTRPAQGLSSHSDQLPSGQYLFDTHDLVADVSIIMPRTLITPGRTCVRGNLKTWNTHIFLADCALLAVISIGHSWASTDSATTLIGAIVTLIADPDQGARAHIGVTYNALPITCIQYAYSGTVGSHLQEMNAPPLPILC